MFSSSLLLLNLLITSSLIFQPKTILVTPGVYNLNKKILNKYGISERFEPNHFALVLNDNKVAQINKFKKFEIISVKKYFEENNLQNTKFLYPKLNSNSIDKIYTNINIVIAENKDYNIINNNCEHLVNFLLYNQSKSYQIIRGRRFITKYLKDYITNSNKNKLERKINYILFFIQKFII